MNVTIGENKVIKTIPLIREETRNARTLPLMLSIVLIFIIIAIVIVARGSIVMTKDIATQSNKGIFFDDAELNNSEKNILAMLPSSSAFQRTYVKYLKECFASSGINVSLEKEEIIKDRITEMSGIITREKNNDVRDMSFEGRGVAIYLAQQIYEECGLILACNINGDITKISDSYGNVVYGSNNVIQNEFQFNKLAITLTTLLLLFLTCYVLSKKNQLTKKGRYDGFDEKKFA